MGSFPCASEAEEEGLLRVSSSVPAILLTLRWSGSSSVSPRPKPGYLSRNPLSLISFLMVFLIDLSLEQIRIVGAAVSCVLPIMYSSKIISDEQLDGQKSS